MNSPQRDFLSFGLSGLIAMLVVLGLMTMILGFWAAFFSLLVYSLGLVAAAFGVMGMMESADKVSSKDV